jgi:hypothetical protein
VLLTAANWTADELRVVVAQVARFTRLPGDALSTALRWCARHDRPSTCDANLLARILSGASVNRAIGVLADPYYAIRTGNPVKGSGSQINKLFIVFDDPTDRRIVCEDSHPCGVTDASGLIVAVSCERHVSRHYQQAYRSSNDCQSWQGRRHQTQVLSARIVLGRFTLTRLVRVSLKALAHGVSLP